MWLQQQQPTFLAGSFPVGHCTPVDKPKAGQPDMCTAGCASDSIDTTRQFTKTQEKKEKPHRGSRWGESWQEGAAPTPEEALKSSLPTRKGKRPRRTEEKLEASAKKLRRPLKADRGADVPPETSNDSLHASEALAKAAIESGNVSLQQVLEVLRQLQVPPNYTRKNVMPAGAQYIQGMLLGLYSYGGSVGLSAKTKKHQWLTRLLVGAMKAVAPDFPFSSIQINYNYASRPHVDKNNLGTSFIVGCGEYTGGELWVHDESGEDKCTLENEDVTAYYHSGKEFNGKTLQIRDAWTIFDGTKMHYTEPFEGERYSIIYFTSDRYAAAPEKARKGMADAGFDFDFCATDLEKVLKEKHERRDEIAAQVRKILANEERARMLLLGRCMGRVWAAGWGLRCTAVCSEGSDFCGSHLVRNRWKTHGRMDGDLPPKKRDEMAFWQQRMVDSGKCRPCGKARHYWCQFPAGQKQITYGRKFQVIASFP